MCLSGFISFGNLVQYLLPYFINPIPVLNKSSSVSSIGYLHGNTRGQDLAKNLTRP